MNQLPGNLHADASFKSLLRMEGKSLPFNEIQAITSGAQVTATLALAYEQRTANLIAYWNAMTSGDDDRYDTPFQREMDATHRSIRERQGLASDVPNGEDTT